MRFFNTAGPCNPAKHYMLPPLARLDATALERLVTQEAYFVLHAPRQTGKSTAMAALAQQLTQAGQHIGVMVSVQVGSAFPADVGAAENAILVSWQRSILLHLPVELQPACSIPLGPAGTRIGAFLTEWALAAPRPLVVLIDEIDALQDHVLISVLRQLREGFPERPEAFPGTIALIGLRDVRDYKVKSGGSSHLGTASPFNVAARSFTLRDFTPREVESLLDQHTAEAGQVFDRQAQSRIFHLSRGQPWLVNALAKVCVEELVPDGRTDITDTHVDTAREILIRRRQTHLDQLTDKLQEERIRRVVEPILAGDTLDSVPPDDLTYALDLGLVRREVTGRLAIANPIYGEVIPRVLATSVQASLPAIHPSWLEPDGTLDPERLLDAFLAFWRQHGQPLLRGAPYHEIAPHLVLMAFLHRVVNDHGRVERDYAVGSGRIDLCLYHGNTRMAMELKVWRDGRASPVHQGLVQLDAYLGRLGLDRGWLVVFDQRVGQPDIPERTRVEEQTTPAGRKTMVIYA